MRSRGSRRRIARISFAQKVSSAFITRRRAVEAVGTFFGTAPTLDEVLRVLEEIEAAVNG